MNADTTTYDCQPIIAEIDAILFQVRSKTFMKKTVNLVSIYKMNCSEFASLLYGRIYPLDKTSLVVVVILQLLLHRKCLLSWKNVHLIKQHEFLD